MRNEDYIGVRSTTGKVIRGQVFMTKFVVKCTEKIICYLIEELYWLSPLIGL
jgi:hypothetical protein